MLDHPLPCCPAPTKSAAGLIAKATDIAEAREKMPFILKLIVTHRIPAQLFHIPIRWFLHPNHTLGSLFRELGPLRFTEPCPATSSAVAGHRYLAHMVPKAVGSPSNVLMSI